MTDWLLTIRQAAPRLPRLLCSLAPTMRLEHVGELDDAALARERVRGLIWDVDGTITYAGGCEPAPEAEAAIQRLHRAEGVRHVILSNGTDARCEVLSVRFPDVPVLTAFRTPAGVAFRRMQAGRVVWSGAEANGGSMRRIRKPSEDLVRFAVRELDLHAAEVAMVGDQYLTDIAGANLAGVRSIKVPTLGRSTFPFAVRVLMRIDEWLFRLTGALLPRARVPAERANGRP